MKYIFLHTLLVKWEVDDTLLSWAKSYFLFRCCRWEGLQDIWGKKNAVRAWAKKYANDEWLVLGVCLLQCCNSFLIFRFSESGNKRWNNGMVLFPRKHPARSHEKFSQNIIMSHTVWLDWVNSLKTGVAPLSSTWWDPGEKIRNPLSQSNKDTKDTDVKDHKRYPKERIMHTWYLSQPSQLLVV